MDEISVAFYAESLEDARSAWIQLEEAEEKIQWRRGAIAAAVSEGRVYGKGSLKQFAKKMGVSYSTARDYAVTYQRIQRLETVAQETVLGLRGLKWTHFRVCAPVKDDEEYVMLLTQAHDKGWSVSKLSRQVAIQKQLREQAEKLLNEAPEKDEEDPGTGEQPPEARHPVLGRIGYLRPEIRETMSAKLDAMDEDEREDAYRRLATFEPMFTRALAGLPMPKNKMDTEVGTPVNWRRSSNSCRI